MLYEVITGMGGVAVHDSFFGDQGYITELGYFKGEGKTGDAASDN